MNNDTARLIADAYERGRVDERDALQMVRARRLAMNAVAPACEDRAPLTDETVERAAHAAYMAGAGAFANMFVIERWMRAALEAARGE